MKCSGQGKTLIRGLRKLVREGGHETKALMGGLWSHTRKKKIELRSQNNSFWNETIVQQKRY